MTEHGGSPGPGLSAGFLRQVISVQATGHTESDTTERLTRLLLARYAFPRTFVINNGFATGNIFLLKNTLIKILSRKWESDHGN